MAPSQSLGLPIFCSKLSTLRNSEEYSDLKIVCGTTTFNAHRAVVCIQSKFFEAACKQGFKEGSTGTVQLEEEEVIHVRAMIEYLYTFEYREAEGDALKLCISHESTGEHTYACGCKLWPFALSIAMHVLGDKYDIESLIDYASTKVDQILRYSKFTPEELVSAIYYAYQNSQPGDIVRQIITQCIIQKVARKSKHGNLSYADNFYDIIKEMPELNEALIRYLIEDR